MSFFADSIPPFDGIDIGWDQDPSYPIGDYEVSTEPPIDDEETFRHFDIRLDYGNHVDESAGWNGYVGNGALFSVVEDLSDPFVPSMETWNQIDQVFHQGTNISLDLITFPYETGLNDMVEDETDAWNLDSDTTYYVYLQIVGTPTTIYQDNTTGGLSTDSSIVFEQIIRVETLFTLSPPVTGQVLVGASCFRYYPLGIVKTPAGDTGAQITKFRKDAIYLEPVVRGRLIGDGLSVTGDGDIVNLNPGTS